MGHVMRRSGSQPQVWYRCHGSIDLYQHQLVNNRYMSDFHNFREFQQFVSLIRVIYVWGSLNRIKPPTHKYTTAKRLPPCWNLTVVDWTSLKLSESTQTIRLAYGERSGKPLPVFGHHGGFLQESTAVSSHS